MVDDAVSLLELLRDRFGYTRTQDQSLTPRPSLPGICSESVAQEGPAWRRAGSPGTGQTTSRWLLWWKRLLHLNGVKEVTRILQTIARDRNRLLDYLPL
jgi:hypothetical protein